MLFTSFILIGISSCFGLHGSFALALLTCGGISFLRLLFPEIFWHCLVNIRGRFFSPFGFGRVYSDIFLFILRRNFVITCVILAYRSVFFFFMRRRSTSGRRLYCDSFCVCRLILIGLYIAHARRVTRCNYSFDLDVLGGGAPSCAELFHL